MEPLGEDMMRQTMQEMRQDFSRSLMEEHREHFPPHAQQNLPNSNSRLDFPDQTMGEITNGNFLKEKMTEIRERCFDPGIADEKSRLEDDEDTEGRVEEFKNEEYRDGVKEESHDNQRSESSKIKSCGQCDFVFETIKQLMYHVKNTPDHSPQCVHCDSKFSNFNNYRHHVRKFHMKESEIICQECGKTSTTQEQQQLHWNFVHKVEEDLFCNLCGRECQNMFKLR